MILIYFSNIESRILPLKLRLFGYFFPNRIKLTVFFFLYPEIINLRMNFFKFWLFSQNLMPFGQFWKILCFMENFRPIKDSWKHELHEYGGWKPSYISMSDIVTTKVWAYYLLLKPR